MHRANDLEAAIIKFCKEHALHCYKKGYDDKNITTYTLDGATVNKVPIGGWEITIKRI